MNLMLITFLCKMADNALSTMKNIYLHKGKYLQSSIFSAASTFFYMTAIVNTIKDNSFGSIVAMCVATFLGSYLPAIVLKRMENDSLFVYEVTTDTFESGLELTEKFKLNNIAVKSMTAYNDESIKVMSCKIYCNTKAESKMVKEMIEGYKYHAYQPVEY